MANVTNMAASANVATGNVVDANNHSDNHSNKRSNKQNSKGVKIADALASSTESVFSPPSTWPAWMQRAMMDNGRVAFRGSKIGIKIGTTLHNEPCSLAEMIKIIEAYQKRLYPDMKQSDFRRRPTPSYLRRHCTCIAFYRAEEGSRADCDFSIILYDNGWFEYWGTGRRTTLYLPDCTEFIYKYNLAIDEIDKITVDQSVLGNTDWYTVATLFAEERITQNMVGYGGNASCDDGGAGVGAGTGAETDEGQPISESKKVTEIVGAAHIPTPEERLLKEERRAEMSKIIAKATAKLTDKQAEVYKLHIEYGYSLERTSEMLGLTGVRFEEGKNSNSEETEEETEVGDAGEVIFDGFKGVPFANNCGTYSRLMFHINKNALERKSIKARDLTDEEMRDGKRTFAAWLTSIGMKDDADTDGVFADDRERLLTLVEGVMRAVRARAARRAAAAKAAEDKAATKTAAAGM